MKIQCTQEMMIKKLEVIFATLILMIFFIMYVYSFQSKLFWSQSDEIYATYDGENFNPRPD